MVIMGTKSIREHGQPGKRVSNESMLARKHGYHGNKACQGPMSARKKYLPNKACCNNIEAIENKQYYFAIIYTGHLENCHS